MGDAKKRQNAADRKYNVPLSERQRAYLLTFWNAIGATKDASDRRILNRTFDQLDMDAVDLAIRGGKGTAAQFSDESQHYELSGDVLDYMIEQLDREVRGVSAYISRVAGQVRDQMLDEKNRPEAPALQAAE